MSKVVKIEPLGFCFGVVRALKMTDSSLKDDVPLPIYLIGSLVHNRFVNAYFNSLGIIILDGSDKEKAIYNINEGTVIFTAHGTANAIKEKAINKGLTVIDATCPFVTKSFELINESISLGSKVLYLGKKGHPETEAALTLNKNVYLIESVNDLDQLQIGNDIYTLTNQTTMSVYDIEELEKTAKLKIPNLKRLDKVCYATKIRQEGLMTVAKRASEEGNIVFIVIGDNKSNNTKKLAETAANFSGKDVYQVEHIEDLPFDKLGQYDKIYLASGTSTPYAIVDEIYEYLLKGDFSPTTSKLKLEDFND